MGGDPRVSRLSKSRFAAFIDQLAVLARAGFGIAVTPSRRTGPAAEELLRDRLAGLPALIWDGAGDNPYFGLLVLADDLLVTADSVSLGSEYHAHGNPSLAHHTRDVSPLLTPLHPDTLSRRPP